MIKEIIIILIVLFLLIFIYKILKFLFKWALIVAIVFIVFYFLSFLTPSFDSYILENSTSKKELDQINIDQNNLIILKSGVVFNEKINILFYDLNEGKIIINQTEDVLIGAFSNEYNISNITVGEYELKIISDDYQYTNRFLAMD